jgi:hypothetical protein
MRFSPGSLSLSALAVSLALVACTSSGGGDPKQNTGAAGSSGSTGGAGTTSSAGTTGEAGSSGSTGAAGTTGSAGTSGGAGTTGSAGTTGAAGATGSAGTTGAAGTGSNHDGGTIGDGGPVTTAGCAGKNYALCMDFESPVDTAVWSGGNANAIETTEVAHGAKAYHLYSKAGMPAGGTFTTAKLGTLKDQIWGRAYIRFSPGAPGGHGNLIAASDGVWSGGNYNGNWYEIGWQFQGIMGVFHTSTSAERPLRSLPYLADKWYCLEFFIDGTMTGGGTVNGDGTVKGSPRWWLDGTEVQYYTPNKGVCCATSNPATPASVLIPQFKSITVGWTPYAGLGLMLPDQNMMVDNRVLTDAWIDDVAFDTKRIGCIQ